jgi:hypothetical protein
MNKVGTRIQVMKGTAKQTGGGLKKKDLTYNKHGKIISKKASAIAKKKMKGGGQVGGEQQRSTNVGEFIVRQRFNPSGIRPGTIIEIVADNKSHPPKGPGTITIEYDDELESTSVSAPTGIFSASASTQAAQPLPSRVPGGSDVITLPSSNVGKSKYEIGAVVEIDRRYGRITGIVAKNGLDPPTGPGMLTITFDDPLNSTSTSAHTGISSASASTRVPPPHPIPAQSSEPITIMGNNIFIVPGRVTIVPLSYNLTSPKNYIVTRRQNVSDFDCLICNATNVNDIKYDYRLSDPSGARASMVGNKFIFNGTEYTVRLMYKVIGYNLSSQKEERNASLWKTPNRMYCIINSETEYRESNRVRINKIIFIDLEEQPNRWVITRSKNTSDQRVPSEKTFSYYDPHDGWKRKMKIHAKGGRIDFINLTDRRDQLRLQFDHKNKPRNDYATIIELLRDEYSILPISRLVNLHALEALVKAGDGLVEQLREGDPRRGRRATFASSAQTSGQTMVGRPTGASHAAAVGYSAESNKYQREVVGPTGARPAAAAEGNSGGLQPARDPMLDYLDQQERLALDHLRLNTEAITEVVQGEHDRRLKIEQARRLQQAEPPPPPPLPPRRTKRQTWDHIPVSGTLQASNVPRRRR